MAFFQVNFFSPTLGFNTDIDVFIPTPNSDEVLNKKKSEYFQKNRKYQVLYLLHGLSDDDSIWLRRTSIERYATEKGIAVVMPTTFRGWYIDTPAGKYYSYIGEELPRRVAEFFPAISQARADTYVAGLSMGGYVAMDIQRLYPETVAGLALCDTMAASDGVGGENRLKMADAAEQTNSVEPVMHFAQPADGDSTVKKTPEFIATMTGWINEQNPAGLAWRQRMTYGRPELGAVPETISAPSLVVSGELDPSSNPSVMRPLAERITGAEFIDIPDCGHFSAVEHPDTVARALLSLVKRVQSAQKNA